MHTEIRVFVFLRFHQRLLGK